MNTPYRNYVLKAAMRGMLADANVLDSRWWLKLNWIVQQLRKDDNLEINKFEYQRTLVSLDTLRGNADPHAKSLRDRLIKREGELVEAIRVHVYGEEERRENREKSLYLSMQKAWEMSYGNQNDPAVKNMIERTAKALAGK